MSVTGPAEKEEESQPYKVGAAIVDVATGLYASNAILASLYRQQQTKQGEHVELCLYDVAVNLLVNQATNYLVSGKSPKRLGNAYAIVLLLLIIRHPNISPYELLQTKDGGLVIAVGNDKQFADLCLILGEPALSQDVRFKTNEQRVKHRIELIPQLEKHLKQKTRQEWISLCQSRDIPVGPVNTIGEAFSDIQAQERNLVWNLPKLNGTVPTVGNPLHFDTFDMHAQQHLAPPLLGEHTESILKKQLQLSDEQIATYKKQGII